MKASHRISVLGKEITVRSSASPEQVREVEALVNLKLAEARASAPSAVDPQIPVILALMNLAETCISLSRQLEERNQAEREMMGRIVQRLEKVLP